MPLERVISGAQTGADRGGLIAARAAGLSTGGWMPAGFLAYDGCHPEFAELYGIRETVSRNYPPRTERNVRDADATLRFASNWETPGELLTLAMCRKHGKPHLDITPGGGTTPADVAEWIDTNGVGLLNVAGNAEQTSPGIQDYVVEFLGEVFRLLVLSSRA
jgi:hypothetical protein